MKSEHQSGESWPAHMPDSTLGESRDPVTINLRPSAFLSPVTMAALAMFLCVFPPLASSSEQRSFWGQNWVIESDYYRTILIGFASLFIGMGVSALTETAGPKASSVTISPVTVIALRRSATILFWLFIVAYAVWITNAIARGFGLQILLNLVSGEGGSRGAREDFATIPGVTTLTQVGPYLAALLALLGRTGMRVAPRLTICVALSAFRLLANSERLGLIEVAVPLAVVLLITERGDIPRRGKLPNSNVKRWVPLLAPVALYLTFTLAEAGRSWNDHYASRFDGTLWTFGFDRIWAYYATAANNSALYAEGFANSHSEPVFAYSAIWNAPILPDLLAQLKIEPTFDWLGFLSRVNNPEFNNPGTILVLNAELGTLITGAILGIIGFGLFRLHAKAYTGNISALLAYASLIIGIIELPRYPYYFGGRFIPVALAIFLTAFLVKRSSNLSRDASS